MRLHIHTTPNTSLIPFNYQQKLTGTLHKWLGENNEEHGEISLYSFSWLQNTKVEKDGLNCPKGSKWFISFHDTQKLKSILASIRVNPEMFCGMIVDEVTIEETPDLSNRELFFLGSPILIKRHEEEKVIEYDFENPLSGKLLEDTLKTKMQKAGIQDDGTLHIEFDLSYANSTVALIIKH